MCLYVGVIVLVSNSIYDLICQEAYNIQYKERNLIDDKISWNKKLKFCVNCSSSDGHDTRGFM